MIGPDPLTAIAYLAVVILGSVTFGAIFQLIAERRERRRRL